MPRVKIKHPDPSGQNKLLLLRTLSEQLIYATKIIQTADAFIVLTRTDDDADKIFSTTTSELLKQTKFQPVLPPEIRAKRTIILFNTDEHIYNQTEKDLEEELVNENSFLNEGIDNIFKIPKTRIIKITLNSSVAAKKATENGLLAFHMSIPHFNLKIEDYIPILTCLRCYAIDEHLTNKCPKEKDYLVCSECASEHHVWKNCTSPIKKCINCGGDHRTLANKCPVRKRVKEEKRKEKQAAKTRTYSQATQQPNPATHQSTINPTSWSFADKDTNIKIASCMMHAHFLNSLNPGCFNEELNKLYKANNLPSIIIPEDPPSKEILNLTQGKESIDRHDRQTPCSAQTNPLLKTTQQRNLTQSEPLSTDQQTGQTTTDDVIPPLEKISGTRIGLQIITKKSEGWPQCDVFSLRRLRAGFDTGLYKWRYNDNSYQEEEIFNYIMNNEIEFDKCWCSIEDYKFNKIHNGLTIENTPPPSKILKHNEKQRHRHSSK